MRITTLLVLILCGSVKIFSQGIRETPIESSVKKVKLYFSSALETRTGKITLDAGMHDVVFTQLPASLLEESIRATGTGAATILSVSARREFLQEGLDNPELKLLDDSIQILESRLTLKRGLKDVYATTRRLILANRVVKSKTTGMEPEDVIEMADMYREKLKSLDEKNISNDIEMRKLNQRLARLRNQYTEASGGKKQASSEVVVRVRVGAKTEINFNLEYLTLDAGWEPLYDIRTEGIGTPVVFQFKSGVWQNTGTDWKNVDITLSTGNPLESIDKPEVRSQLLSFYSPGNYKRKASGSYGNTQSSYDYEWSQDKSKADENYNVRKAEVDALKKELEQKQAYYHSLDNGIRLDSISVHSNLIMSPDAKPMVYSVEQVRGYLDSDAGVSTEFMVTTPYSIPSDGKIYNVDVHEKSATSLYRYFAIPSKSAHAYLTARIPNWDQLNLVPATASIFNQGTFVGRIEIDPNTTDDTLEISLGKDKNIAVQKLPVPNKTSKNTSSSTIREQFAFEVKVANNKSGEIELLILENIPVSPMKEVVVDITETGKAEMDKEKGQLKWLVKLAAGDKKVFPIEYTVKYPKTMVITNL